MRHEARNALAVQLSALAQCARHALDNEWPDYFIVWGIPGEERVGLPTNLREDYRKAQIAFLKGDESWRERYADHTLLRMLDRLLVDLSKDPTLGKAVSLFNELVSSLDAPGFEVDVVTPLWGILMGDQPLQVGPVTLSVMTHTRFDVLVQRMQRVFEGIAIKMDAVGARGPSEQMRKGLGLSYAASIGGFLGQVCAWAKAVVSDCDKGKQISDIQTDRVLDILSWAASAVLPPGTPIGISRLPGVAPNLTKTTVIATDDTRCMNVTAPTRPLVPVELNSATVSAMNTVGMTTVGNILSRPEREWTDFERHLVRALHWFGNGRIQMEPENAVLSLAICLETLFSSRQNGDRVVRSVAEGVAYVLGNSYNERRKLTKRTNDFYEIRSAIAHGRGAQVTWLDADSSGHFVAEVLVGIVKRLGQFQSKHELLSWLEERRLSG